LAVIIIKLGGSLMHSNNLTYWLRVIFDHKRNNTVVVVPGGGEFADSIRNIQQRRNFHNKVAHKMALLAMSQYGYFLTSLNSNIKIIKTINLLPIKEDSNNSYLWLPNALLDNSEGIDETWNSTSDSIALWLAIKLSAEKLIIVKSKKIILNRSKIVENIKNNDLDKSFGLLFEKFNGEFFCLHKSEYNQLEAVLSSK
tara:strand:- start:938 stop:1531 length:594 start_codon:yes stop_codon:yes gene_type:complete